MKFWYSYLIGKCFWCKSRNIIYIFQRCGKYHHTLMCDNCLQQKLQKNLQQNNTYYPINPDPLGMKIKIYKSII